MLDRLKRLLKARLNASTGIDYEGAWDRHARRFETDQPNLQHIGDEWTGRRAGAAQSLEEYTALIEERFIEPYVMPGHTVLEIGVGGGRTAELLLQHGERLICADISAQMLRATRKRLGTERTTYVKLDGLTLNGIPERSADVCFCFATMVHMEPRDIFNYLTRIPARLRGERLCIFHHSNTLTELGFKRFLRDWDKNLMGKRGGKAFSVMTDALMERFLTHLGYEIQLKDVTSVPRDCIWICTAPLDVPEDRLR